jgi:hypothetical protein
MIISGSDREGRSLAKHQAWVAALPCPTLRLDGSRPLPELVAEVCGAIEQQARRAD